tara:strand:+ start:746 stop:1060 length:315 start_codon:yes stop_codon:yes gene_type:complete
MASEIHVDDVGTRFLVTIKDDSSTVDLSDATLKQLNFRKPDDSVISRSASFIAGGSQASGVMYYDSVVGDLDQAGNYKLQGKVTIPSGTYYTDIHTFKVYCNLE